MSDILLHFSSFYILIIYIYIYNDTFICILLLVFIIIYVIMMKKLTNPTNNSVVFLCSDT